MTQEQRGTINSVSRALQVIQVLVDCAPSASLGQIADAAQLPLSTAYRILQTLVHHEYASSLDDGIYKPGPAILTLAGQLLASMDYSQFARPALLELQEATPETIHFGVLMGDVVQYVDKIESRRPYRLASVVGMRLALHSTAIGKAILAFLPPTRLDSLISSHRLDAHTSNTLTDRGLLEEDLDRIRKRGFSLDNEEDREGVRCVGAPVFDHRGDVIGAISVSAPAFQFTKEQAKALAGSVMRAARSTSLSLRASPEALPLFYRELESNESVPT